jgi:hypothetical protein
MSKCWTKLVCVCHDVQQEVQDNPHFLTKGITSTGKWDYGHDPETEQLFSQHECSDYGRSAHRISPSQTEVSPSSITKVCHGLHGWSTAKWQMETGSLWQLIWSYNFMYSPVHGKKKKMAPLPPPPFLSGPWFTWFNLVSKDETEVQWNHTQIFAVVLNSITKDEIQAWCFWQWQNHEAWYMNSLGEYPEGNMIYNAIL